MGGRNDDVIILPSGRMRPGIAFYPVMPLTEIYSYQIIQERPDLLVFRYVPVEKDISDYLRKDLAKELRKACLGESISIEFERVSSIKRGRTGKINTIISKIS
jgi:phenylacetate-coenzyme A ligase PaaK-like adenylate-forming protein